MMEDFLGLIGYLIQEVSLVCKRDKDTYSRLEVTKPLNLSIICGIVNVK